MATNISDSAQGRPGAAPPNLAAKALRREVAAQHLAASEPLPASPDDAAVAPHAQSQHDRAHRALGRARVQHTGRIQPAPLGAAAASPQAPSALPPISLPAPASAPIDAARARSFLQRTAAFAADRAAASPRGSAAAPPPPAAPDAATPATTTTPPGPQHAAASPWPPAPGIFQPADLRLLRRHYGVSPRALAMLTALNAPHQSARAADTAKAPASSENAGATSLSPAVGPPGASFSRNAPPPSSPNSPLEPAPAQRSRNAAATQANARRAPMAFSLRGTRPVPAEAAGSAGASRSPTAGRATAFPTELSWSAFAALLSHAQLKALLELLLWRHRDLSLQRRNEEAVQRLELRRVRDAVRSERLSQATQLLSQKMSAQAEYASARAGTLHNAGKAAARVARGIVPHDGAQAAHLRSEMRTLERRLARTQAAQAGSVADASLATAAHNVLAWVPGNGDQPARSFARVALGSAELAGFSDAERARYTELQQALRNEEMHDFSGQFGRWSLSAAQLEQAAEQTDAAAQAASQRGDAAADGLHRLAERYAHLALEHRDAAFSCGYLQAVVTASRAAKPALAGAIGNEQAHRRDAEQKIAAARQTLQAPSLSQEQKKRTEAALQEAEVRVEDCNFRLVGMAAAATCTDRMEHADSLRRHASGTPDICARAQAIVDGQLDATTQQERQRITDLQHDFASALPSEVVRASMLSAMFARMAHNSSATLEKLASTNSSAQDAAAQMALLQRKLVLLPGYTKLCQQVTRARMAQHVRERTLWDAQPEAATRLKAEARFWESGAELTGKPAPDSSWRAVARRLMPLASAPHGSDMPHGAKSLNDPALSPIARFAFPTRVDLLHSQGRDEHLKRSAANAATWAESYQDTTFARLNQAAQYSSFLSSFAEQATQGTRGIAEGAVDDLAALIEEGRNEAYAKMSAEQAGTFALHQQLRQLLSVGG